MTADFPSLPSIGETARSEDVAVPREPTEAMLRACEKHSLIDRHGQFIPMRAIPDVYKTMLVAAPRPDAGAIALQERRRIADALEAEGETLPCKEDGDVYASAAWLVRGDFSYNEAERLELAGERVGITSDSPTPTGDVTAKLAEWPNAIRFAIAQWQKCSAKVQELFHAGLADPMNGDYPIAETRRTHAASNIDKLLNHDTLLALASLAERAAALEQENERLRRLKTLMERPDAHDLERCCCGWHLELRRALGEGR